MYYITMTDKVLSGWGKASGKVAKYVLMTSSAEKAERAYNNALSRKDMKYVRLGRTFPRYSSSRYQVTYRDDVRAASWFE